MGEKYKPEDKIIASLCYYSINSKNQSDDRDIILALTVIYNSILLNNQNPIEIFNQIANVSDQKFSKVLKDFLLRDEEDKSMDAFLLKMKRNEYGEIEIILPW